MNAYLLTLAPAPETPEEPEEPEAPAAPEAPAEEPEEEPFEYPWMGLSDAELITYLYAPENAAYLIALLSHTESEEYISFRARVKATDTAEDRALMDTALAALAAGQTPALPAEPEDESEPAEPVPEPPTEPAPEEPEDEGDKTLLAEIIASGTCGEDLTWALSDAGVLTISGTGAMADYSRMDAPWYSYRDSITSVIIENSVTRIGDFAFYGLQNMTSVTISADVTGIGTYAFSNCKALASATIPANVASIGQNAFSYCESLTSVIIPDGVTSIGEHTFDNCTALISVTIPAGVTSIGEYAFYACKSLSAVTIPDSVTSIGNYAFMNCKLLTSVTVPAAVTGIGTALFRNCSSLTTVTIPASVTSIGSYAFDGTALTDVYYGGTEAQWNTLQTNIGTNNGPLLNATVYYMLFASGTCGADLSWTLSSAGVLTISGTGAMQAYAQGSAPWYSFRNSITAVTMENGITEIGSYAFYDLTGATSITVSTSVTAIGSCAFYSCTGLTVLSIPASVRCTKNMFFGCTGLTSITLTGTGDMANYSSTASAANYYQYTPWYLFRENELTLTVQDGVTSIGSYAFYGCSGLTSVTVPASVTRIGSRAFDDCSGLKTAGPIGGDYDYQFGWTDSIPARAFYNCSGLTSVIIPDSVTSIGSYAFYGCSGLTSVIIPDSVTSIGSSAFYGCSGLTSVTVPDSVTIIGEYAFYGCSGLTSVTIPDSVTDIGQSAFSDCSSLTSITLGNSVTGIGSSAFFCCSGLTSVTIPDSVTDIGQSAFFDCSSLTSITLGNSVTGIGSSVFFGCSGLTSVTVPDSVTSIGEYAFYGCSSLTSITLGNSVTGIGSRAFFGCSRLTAVTVPDSVTSIGEYAFYGCSGLTAVTVPDSVTSIGAYAFCGCGGLKTLSMPASIVCSQTMFYGCTGLSSVTLTGTTNMAGYDADSEENNYRYTPWYLSRDNALTVTVAEGVKSIGSYAFYKCSKLSSIIVPNSVKSFGTRAFYGCSGLRTLSMPASSNFADDVFYGCTGLTSVTLTGGGTMPSYDYRDKIKTPWYQSRKNALSVTITEGVKTISDSTFADCTGLTSLTIPKSLTNINFHAFLNCDNLLDVWYGGTLSKRNGIPIAIGNDSITSATWHYESAGPDYTWDLTGGVLTISGSGEMPVCKDYTQVPWYSSRADITSVTISSGFTTVAPYLLYGCTCLTSVTVPASVTSIGAGAFAGCEKLKTVIFMGSAPNIGEDSFSNVTAAVTVPADDASWTPEKKQNYGGRLTWNTAEFGSAEKVTLSHEYLLLEKGDTAALVALVTPQTHTGNIVWASGDEDIATVSVFGKVTAVGSGMTYITASVTANGRTLSASCRVDVAAPEKPLQDQVSEVQLITASASVNVYMTAGCPTVTVLPVLAQNKGTAAAEPDAGVAITAARFLDESVNTYFTLRVKDDRTLEVIPTEQAVADALAGSKALKTSYSSAIVVTIDGKEYTTEAKLKLSVKKTKPTVKAKAVAFNSALVGTAAEPVCRIIFTGADVIDLAPDETAAAKAKKPAVPEYISLDAQTGTVQLLAAESYAAKGNLYLLATPEGWSVPVSVKVPYTVKKTVPKLKFGAKSVTLLQGTKDQAQVGITVTPDPFTDSTLFPITVGEIEKQNGGTYEVIPADTELHAAVEDGILTLSAPTASEDGMAHTYRVTLWCAGKDFPYIVKTLAAATEPALTAKVTGAINTKTENSPVTVTLTPKNFHAGSGEEYSLERVEQYKGNVKVSEDVKDLFAFSANEAGNVFTFTEKESGTLVSGHTYKAVFTVDLKGDGTSVGEAAAVLKITFAKTAPAISLSAKAKGSIDVARPGTAITLTPTLKNWFGSEEQEPVFFEKVGTQYSEFTGDHPAPFTYTKNDDGTFTVTAGEGLTAASGVYYAAVRIVIDGKIYPSNYVKLSVKQGKVKVQSSTTSVVLYKNDRFSRAPFTLTVADGTVSPIARAELDTASAAKFELIDLGNGTFALEYKDNALPTAFKASTVKLSVFVAGCEKPVATVKLKVSYK